MTRKPRKPAAFKLDAPNARPAASQRATKQKARKPQAVPISEAEIEQSDPVEDVQVAQQAASVKLRRSFRWGGLLASSLTLLAGMLVTLSAVNMIEELFARAGWLGWTAVAFTALSSIALLALIAREVLALLRLRQLGKLQANAANALNSGDREACGNVLSDVRSLYAKRTDLRWQLDRLAQSEQDIMDPEDRIRLIERDLLTSLDENATRIIARSARRVGLTTAILPAATLDILVVGYQNLAMLRAIAGLYGGRPGTLGSFRLARMVVSHLAVAGSLAMTDTMVQQAIGRGLLGRLSSRFGEGAVNGIMTARIGLAALELCRPLPFGTSKAPTLGDLVGEISGLGAGDR